ncbi:uncharacterized protein LOC113581335 [Electrophorus electricus]|uniref:uncharacterized protein LOC113581335 n=1 Tax=Electrophorus electricus TaxID=8005 RepID=UPI0015D042DA|nr:uncharacterized protein LOC113581335 [Electrophorus electricus]
MSMKRSGSARSSKERADLQDEPLENPDLVLWADGSASRDPETGKLQIGVVAQLVAPQLLSFPYNNGNALELQDDFDPDEEPDLNPLPDWMMDPDV